MKKIRIQDSFCFHHPLARLAHTDYHRRHYLVPGTSCASGEWYNYTTYVATGSWKATTAHASVIMMGTGTLVPGTATGIPAHHRYKVPLGTSYKVLVVVIYQVPGTHPVVSGAGFQVHLLVYRYWYNIWYIGVVYQLPSYR